VTDNADVTARTGWTPRRTLDRILDDIFAWLREHRAALAPLLGGDAVAPRAAASLVLDGRS
jgi:CDP-paratose 2-epimerase